MVILYSIFFCITLIVSAFAYYIRVQSQKNVENLCSSDAPPQSFELSVIYKLAKENEVYRLYVIRNGVLFLYPFAAMLISAVAGFVSIFYVILFIVALFLKHFLLACFCGIFFFLTGFVGARYNKNLVDDISLHPIASKIGYEKVGLIDVRHNLQEFHKKHAHLLKNRTNQ